MYLTQTKNSALVHKHGKHVSIKTADNNPNIGWVEGYLVSWGDSQDRDLQGEYFTPRTEFCLDWFKERPVLYHHGLDGHAGLRKIGVIKSIEPDELGLWVQAQVDLRDKYAAAVYDMVKSQDFGWSSGSVDHLVKIADDGEIATWPIIEGSITPTPAQPSKTTVRAFKAVVDDNVFLRGLDKHLTFSEIAARVVNDKNSHSAYKSVNRNSPAYTLAKRYARLFGVRVKESELAEIASQMEDVVDSEIAYAASEELEMLAELEEEMTQEPEEYKMARLSSRSRRSTRRSPRNNSYRRYRSNGDISVNSDDIAAQLEDELAAQMGDIADGIASSVEDEVAAQMEQEAAEKHLSRQIMKRARRRALRQLTATDDVEADLDAPPTVIGGVGADNYVGDPNSVAVAKRARRRAMRRYRSADDALMTDPYMTDDPLASELEVAKRMRRRRAMRSGSRRRSMRRYRSNGDALMSDLEAVAADENAILMEEVAKRAHANGMRKGIRRAMRMNDVTGVSEIGITEENNEVGSVGATASYRRRRALRNASRRRSMRRSPRRSMRRRSYRNTDEALLSDDALMTDDPLASELEVAKRTRRRAMRRTSSRSPYRRASRRRSYRNTDEALLSDDALMNDDALMSDEPIASRRYRSRRMRGKAMNRNTYSSRTEQWKRNSVRNRNSRSGGIKSSMRVTDVADRNGAYSDAFKTYLLRGDRGLTPTEQYVLNGKGRTNWGATKGFASPLGVDPRIKTYYGGSDASAGFAVPPDWVAELNKNTMTQTVMAPECRTRVTTSDRIVQPTTVTTDARRSHAAQVRWPGEVISSNTEHRSIEDTYAQIEIPIHPMLMSLTASNQALEDVTFNLEDEINEAFSEAVAVAYDTLIWSGDGQGKLQGIVTSNQVIGQPSTGVATPSGYIASGSPDGIINADVVKQMFFHLPRNYRQRAKWYMNSDTGLELSTLKDGNGNYLIDQRDESLQSVGVPGRLLGRPIVYNEYADGIATNGYPLLFGDLSRAYVIGKRVDFSIRRFDDSAYAELDQVLFLGRARLGGQVIHAPALKVLKIASS